MKKSNVGKNRKKGCIYCLRIVITLLTGLMLAWIFSNSLKTGTESSGQSSRVVDFIQKLIKIIAPNSALANATGEAYDKLHSAIRILAHFGEFAVLGALVGWTYSSYTSENKWLFLPLYILLLIPVIDEHLQSFIPGRGAEFFDICVDTTGAICGLIFSVITVWLGRWLYASKQKKGLPDKEKGEV